MIGSIGPNGLAPDPGQTPPTPQGFPPCAARGVMVESGIGCRCGPKYMCLRDTRIVAASDCAACDAPVRVEPAADRPDGV